MELTRREYTRSCVSHRVVLTKEILTSLDKRHGTYLSLNRALGLQSSKSRKWAEKTAHPKESIFSLPTSNVATEDNEKQDAFRNGARMLDKRAFPRKQDQNIIKELSTTPKNLQHVCPVRFRIATDWSCHVSLILSISEWGYLVSLSCPGSIVEGWFWGGQII